MPAVDTLLELCTERRALRTRTDKGHPFCQDEKTLKASICWIIGFTCRFLYCQWHCGQRIAPANRGCRFAHNKNARRRFEGSDRARRRPLPLSGIVPLGRIPNGTIPRKRRAATWTSTTEASKCSLPPGSAAAKPRLLVRSRAFPTRHPASLPGRAHLGR